jgi:hypothetical protein
VNEVVLWRRQLAELLGGSVVVWGSQAFGKRGWRRRVRRPEAGLRILTYGEGIG